MTTDNFFTSVNLAKTLRQQGISIAGTVNRIRKEIPQEIKKIKEDLYTIKVFKHNGCTLKVYQAKTTKNVLLLSTMHSTVDIGDDRKSKPETVNFYNFTDFGVDVVDQMARKYTVNAASRRWPVQFFYNILDLALINAHILYKLVIGSRSHGKDIFCHYPKGFVQYLLKKEKLTHTSPISPTAVCINLLPINIGHDVFCYVFLKQCMQYYFKSFAKILKFDSTKNRT